MSSRGNSKQSQRWTSPLGFLEIWLLAPRRFLLGSQIFSANAAPAAPARIVTTASGRENRTAFSMGSAIRWVGSVPACPGDGCHLVDGGHHVSQVLGLRDRRAGRYGHAPRPRAAAVPPWLFGEWVPARRYAEHRCPHCARCTILLQASTTGELFPGSRPKVGRLPPARRLGKDLPETGRRMAHRPAPAQKDGGVIAPMNSASWPVASWYPVRLRRVVGQGVPLAQRQTAAGPGARRRRGFPGRCRPDGVPGSGWGCRLYSRRVDRCPSEAGPPTIFE
jgi:hypothetical protein